MRKAIVAAGAAALIGVGVGGGVAISAAAHATPRHVTSTVTVTTVTTTSVASSPTSPPPNTATPDNAPASACRVSSTPTCFTVPAAEWLAIGQACQTLYNGLTGVMPHDAQVLSEAAQGLSAYAANPPSTMTEGTPGSPDPAQEIYQGAQQALNLPAGVYDENYRQPQLGAVMRSCTLWGA